MHTDYFPLPFPTDLYTTTPLPDSLSPTLPPHTTPQSSLDLTPLPLFSQAPRELPTIPAVEVVTQPLETITVLPTLAPVLPPVTVTLPEISVHPSLMPTPLPAPAQPALSDLLPLLSAPPTPEMHTKHPHMDRVTYTPDFKVEMPAMATMPHATVMPEQGEMDRNDPSPQPSLASMLPPSGGSSGDNGMPLLKPSMDYTPFPSGVHEPTAPPSQGGKPPAVVMPSLNVDSTPLPSMEATVAPNQGTKDGKVPMPKPSMEYTPYPSVEPSVAPHQGTKDEKVPMPKPSMEYTTYPSMEPPMAPSQGAKDERAPMPKPSMEYTPYPSMQKQPFVTPVHGDRGQNVVLPQPSMGQEPTATPIPTGSDQRDPMMKPPMHITPYPSLDQEPSSAPQQQEVGMINPTVKPSIEATPYPSMGQEPSYTPYQGAPTQTMVVSQPSMEPTPAQTASKEEQGGELPQPSIEYSPYPSMDRPAKSPDAMIDGSAQVEPSASMVVSPEFTGIPHGYTYKDMFPTEPSVGPAIEEILTKETQSPAKPTTQPSEEVSPSIMPTITPSVMTSITQAPTPMVTQPPLIEETPSPSAMVTIEVSSSIMPTVTPSVMTSSTQAPTPMVTQSTLIEETPSPSKMVSPTVSLEPLIIWPSVPRETDNNMKPKPSESTPPPWIDINLFPAQQPAARTTDPDPKPWINVNLNIPVPKRTPEVRNTPSVNVLNELGLRAVQAGQDTHGHSCRTMTGKTDELNVQTMFRTDNVQVTSMNVRAFGHVRGLTCAENNNIPHPEWVAHTWSTGWEMVVVRVGEAHRTQPHSWIKKTEITVQMGTQKTPGVGRLDVTVMEGTAKTALFQDWAVAVHSLMNKCGANKDLLVVTVTEIGRGLAKVQACLKG